MNRTLSYIIIMVIIICSLFISKYYEYANNIKTVQIFNTKYEKYINKELLGVDIANLINLATNDNEEAYVKKDENNKYIENDINSIYIEVKINDLEKDKIYSMEVLYGGGMKEFVKYYGQIKFKSEEVKYNSKGKIKYILFEQIL